jgi:hypothetical protein
LPVGEVQITVPSAGGVSQSTLLLPRFEPKDGDMTANRVCLQAIVAPTGVDLLRKPINTCVVVGVGDLSRQKFLAAQLAFRVRLAVTAPNRASVAATSGATNTVPSRSALTLFDGLRIVQKLLRTHCGLS